MRRTRSTAAALAALLLATGWAHAATVEYTTKTAGAVSLGIYDGQGRLLRTLQSGKQQEAGQNAVPWDGKDDLGRALPPGPYTLKGLVANLGWQYQLMMGNAGRPPYINADDTGGLGTCWGNVLDAVAEVNGKDLYLLWKQEEGLPALNKVDPAGGVGKFKLWGAHNSWAWGSCQALASDAQYVYIANNMSAADPVSFGRDQSSKALLWRVRVDTGEYAFFPGANNAPTLISTIPAATLPALPRSWEMYAHPELRRSPGYAVNFFGLAVDQTHLYCSLRAENKLLILDKTTAAPVKAVAVDEPGGMAMAPDGSLYLLSGQKLLKVSPDGTVLGTVIDRGLEAPYGLCVDAPGNLWISDQGAAMQVKIFSPAGRLLRTVGKAGGRALDGEWAKRRSTAFARPGQFYKPAEFTGIVKGLLFDCDWNGQMRVWDKDTGLYAGSLFQDGYRGPVPDENLVEVEYTNAHVFLWNGDCVALRMSSNPALKWPLEGTREQLKDCPDLFQGGFWWNATKQRTYWQGYHGTGGPELPEDQWAGTAVVVKLAPDGKGYTETIKLPWKTINPNFHPQTGDRIGFTWDLCVSTANAAEPARAFEIFVNAGSTWAFTSPSVWGQAIFQ